ncbi:hypothetical protein P4V86_23295 [Brevibacillus laterosporus]|nr:hypothetical protein [Brevibacillus laterosporus]MED2006251.1 hypothetical protein [Brevibacillus laterosporus]
MLRYKRVLVKLSGGAVARDKGTAAVFAPIYDKQGEVFAGFSCFRPLKP